MRTAKVIFFDAVGTLIHLPRGAGYHYAAIARQFGWNASADSLRDAFRTTWKAMPARANDRQPRADDDRGWWRALVGRMLVRTGAPQGFDASGYFDAVYEEFRRPGVWAMFPETLATLDALAPHHQLAILSNFDGRLRTVLADLGILSRFAELVISSEVGADKPDPWIFQHALARVHAAPHEALLVGDDPECDIAGALRAGWHAFHIDHPRTTLRDLAIALSADPRDP